MDYTKYITIMSDTLKNVIAEAVRAVGESEKKASKPVTVYALDRINAEVSPTFGTRVIDKKVEPNQSNSSVEVHRITIWPNEQRVARGKSNPSIVQLAEMVGRLVAQGFAEQDPSIKLANAADLVYDVACDAVTIQQAAVVEIGKVVEAKPQAAAVVPASSTVTPSSGLSATIQTTKKGDFLTARRVLVGIGAVAPDGTIKDKKRLDAFGALNKMPAFAVNPTAYAAVTASTRFNDGTVVKLPPDSSLICMNKQGSDYTLVETKIPALKVYN